MNIDKNLIEALVNQVFGGAKEVHVKVVDEDKVIRKLETTAVYVAAEVITDGLTKEIEEATKWLDHAKSCPSCSKDTERIAAITNLKAKAEGVLISLAAYKEADEVILALAKDRFSKRKGGN